MEYGATAHSRRRFLGTAALLPAGLGGTVVTAQGPYVGDTGGFVVGPKKGYAPHIGALVSMLDMMRGMVVFSVKGMTTAQLDYLHDEKANSIGAMLMHLAAVERYYQLNTFSNMKGDRLDDAIKKEWDVPMNLGAPARKQLNGRPLEHYLKTLEDVRSRTLAEFKKRDDAWLMDIDKTSFSEPSNNYAKWFHVCEHESNHNGQIKWIAGRLPGAAASVG